MRWRPHPEEEYPRSHREQLVRTIIERIGLEQLCEIIESVVAEMREEDRPVAAAPELAPQIALQGNCRRLCRIGRGDNANRSAAITRREGQVEA